MQELEQGSGVYYSINIEPGIVARMQHSSFPERVVQSTTHA